MTTQTRGSLNIRRALKSILFLLAGFAISIPSSSQSAPIQVPLAYCYDTPCGGGLPIYYPGDIQWAVTRACQIYATHRFSNPNTPCVCSDPRVPCSDMTECAITGYGGGNAFTRISGHENYFTNYNADGTWTVTNYLGDCYCPSGATKNSDATCTCSGTNVWNGMTSTCVASCPAGSSLGGCKQSATVTAHKTQGKACCDSTPNPIQHGTGQKFKEEVIVNTPTLKLVLSYNSTPVNQLPFIEYNFGKGWSFNYGMRVWITQSEAAGALRADGKMLQFLPPASGNTYVAEADVPDKLEKLVKRFDHHRLEIHDGRRHR